MSIIEFDVKGRAIEEIDIVNEDNVEKVWECYLEVCEEKGKILSFEEIWEDIENSIGWKEVILDSQIY